MSIPARMTAVLADSSRFRVSKRILLAGLAAAMAAASPGAHARPAPMGGAYDGTWNVVFFTQAGNCSSTNSVPFAVAGRSVSSAGGGKVTGGINRGGMVAVNISIGASHASGSGRLVGNSGTGRWSGIITGDKCSGSWQATRN
jgi:hypothetical protein